MRDFLLRFPDKNIAVQFGMGQGYTSTDAEGEAQTTLAAHGFALVIIGEHFVPTGNMVESDFGVIPEMAGDGQWWILFRDLAGLPIPPEADPFIVWRSDSGQPRPTDPQYPANTWA